MTRSPGIHWQGAVFFMRLEAALWRVVDSVPSLLGHLPAGTRAEAIVWTCVRPSRH